MEEEVYATWVATALILVVLGTQFSSRTVVKTPVRMSLDLISVGIATLVLAWASLCYFGVIALKHRSWMLIALLVLVFCFFILVSILVGLQLI